MEEILKTISDELGRICVPYEFFEWTGEKTNPYFVGEYSEFEPMTEDGAEEKSFLLTGFCRGANARMRLEEMRMKLEEAFDPMTGKRFLLPSKSVLVVSYANAFYVPSGAEDLYKLQVNLSLKIWKVR